LKKWKNKETYSVAKSLLEKYGEKVAPEAQPTAAAENNTNKDVRQRVSVKPAAPGSDKPAVSVVSSNIGTLETVNPQTSARDESNRLAAGVTPGKLPRAILPPQRTFWGAILDVIVGDGPSKRYALICKSCHSHNGMALEEEFEYISFRCAYCNYFNSARKQKPVFHGDIVAHDPQLTTSQPQNESTVERMEISSSESPDNIAEAESKGTGSNVIRRSVRIADAKNTNESRSRSTSPQKRQQAQPELSSSEENLSKKD